MKKTTLATLLALAILATACHNENKAPVLNTLEDSLSWIMGMNIGKSLNQSVTFNLDQNLMNEAIRYTLDGRQQPIDDTNYEMGMQFIMIKAYQKQQNELNQVRHNADSVEAEYFKNLVANNPNVKAHPSGFYYEVLRQGKGRKAEYGERIRFDYRSYTIDGKVYDQTYEKREPIIHVIGNPMFPGLIDGFQLMNAGSQFRFYFPYKFLGNEAGSGSVKAFMPMIYDIELYEIYNN